MLVQTGTRAQTKMRNWKQSSAIYYWPKTRGHRRCVWIDILRHVNCMLKNVLKKQRWISFPSVSLQECESLVTLNKDLAALLQGSVKCRKGKPPSTKETKKEAFDRYMKIIYELPPNIKVSSSSFPHSFYLLLFKTVKNTQTFGK